MQIEICVESLDSALAAQQGGASRVELCSALREGGLTPSQKLIRSVREALTIQVFVMIRPRTGNFVYSESEYQNMRNDIVTAKKMGCDGVVLGLLTQQGEVDILHTRALVELARPMEVTFHRAFDEARDLDAAMEALIECGADRILTSGGTSNAISGTKTLARLQAQSRGRIQIMAGGRVRPQNVTELLRSTGIRAVHSALISLPDESRSPAWTGEWPVVNAVDVADFRRNAEAAWAS